jgi:hypothetical protein
MIELNAVPPRIPGQIPCLGLSSKRSPAANTSAACTAVRAPEANHKAKCTDVLFLTAFQTLIDNRPAS